MLMEHRVTIPLSAITRLTEGGKSHVALPFHHTTLGYPRVPGNSLFVVDGVRCARLEWWDGDEKTMVARRQHRRQDSTDDRQHTPYNPPPPLTLSGKYDVWRALVRAFRVYRTLYIDSDRQPRAQYCLCVLTHTVIP